MSLRLSIFLYIPLCLLLFSCKETKNNPGEEKATSPSSSLENYISEEGLLIESFDSTRKNDFNKYTADNQIFKPGRIFVYDYIYYNADGQKRLCTILDGGGKIPGNKAWYFAPPKEKKETTISEIHITIINGLGLLQKLKPDYNKTVAKFNYSYINEMSTFREQAGIVENEKNVWMTPPRFRIFRMLELNPYPFIKKPYEVGTKWTWERKIQKRWGDVQWVQWTGDLQNNYTYEITGKKRIDTAFGELECFEVRGTASNEMGTSSLLSYFNPEYGFIRMDYTNIQGTRMVLNLKAINEYQPPANEGE